jgi:hypothetical protein
MSSLTDDQKNILKKKIARIMQKKKRDALIGDKSSKNIILDTNGDVLPY